MKNSHSDRAQILLQNKVSFEKLTMLMDGIPRVVGANILLGLLFVFALESEFSPSDLWSWFALNFILMLMRIIHFIYFKRDKSEEAYAKHYYLALTGLASSALLWAGTAVFFFPESSELRLFLVICIAGLSSGALGSSTAIFTFYSTYVILLLVPFIAVFVLQVNTSSYFIAASLFFYIIFVLIISKKMSKDLDITLNMGYKNESLVRQLKLAAEEARAASEAKSTFLSNMSHEIRTPLNAILGYISILRKKEDDEVKKGQLDIINNSSNVLLQVINDILDYNKITSGNITLDARSCELKKELEGLIELFTPLCQEKGILLGSDIDPGIPRYISTDILRIKQILSNLLSNAIKFTPAGRTIKCQALYKDNRIVFNVIDEGIGIEKEKQKLIFDSFQQADASTTREYGGTGLGLAISSKLAEFFGSTLTVESTVDRGSKFSFSIDAIEADAVEVPTETYQKTFNREKVLVAEDNKTNQMLIKLLLDDMNLETEIAKDGFEAIEMYSDKVSVVLMDINMPKVNGTDAMLDIKRRNPESVIIAVTANALIEDRVKYLEQGFDDYLAKPIDYNELHAVLKKYL